MSSGNQLWSGQKGVIMIRSLSHLTSLPRTNCMMFRCGKTYLQPFGYLSFKAPPQDHLLSKRSKLKYCVTCLKANRSTNGVPHHSYNLWLDESPKLHFWDFLPLHRASTNRLATPLRYYGHTIIPFLWHLSKIFLARLFRVLQWVPTSFNG